ADAQYQIGYIWLRAAQNGTNDAKASENAKVGFQDFLFRHTHSEKVAQAQEKLRKLEHKETTNAFQVARFYDKQKNYRAAVIYYNDVLRQQPGSPEGDRAKRRIGELRAKVGDAALQPPAITAATANKKLKTSPQTAEAGRRSGPSMHTSPNDVAPLPPPESDLSLPPPASLTPDVTTAPASDSSAGSPGPTSESTATPEPTATPSE
ncbi:MAG: hypothetical protein ACR2MF_06745, partial [Chthoniobacterales bacterium]